MPDGGVHRRFFITMPLDSVFYVQNDTIPEACLVYTGFEVDHCLVYTPEEDSLFVLISKTPQQRFITLTEKTPALINPMPIGQPGYFWQFLVLLLAVFIFTYIRFVRKSFYKNLSAAFSSKLLFRQMIRDDLLFPVSSRFPLFVAIVLTYAVLLLQIDEVLISQPFLSKNEELFRLLLYLGTVTGILSLKNLLHWFAGMIFETRLITKEYLTNSFYFNTVGAIFLIPLLMISTFSKSEIILILIIAVAVVLILLKLFRAFTISMGLEKYSYFQNFVYFCTLEILPWLTLYKLVSNGNFD